jgi:ABC-type nitrate/sulfonate/bicarbonate transport system permease component
VAFLNDHPDAANRIIVDAFKIAPIHTTDGKTVAPDAVVKEARKRLGWSAKLEPSDLQFIQRLMDYSLSLGFMTKPIKVEQLVDLSWQRVEQATINAPAVRPSWSWASLPFLLLAWIALVASRFPSYILPQPWEVLAEGLRWLRDGSLGRTCWPACWRNWAALAPPSSWHMLLGVSAGVSPRFRAFISPLNSLFMAIPPVAWAPLTMIIFGLGYVSIMVVIMVAAAFPMAVTIQEGVQAIRGGEVRAARALGRGAAATAAHVYLPASLPTLTAALRIGFSQAWRALVAAEMVGASKGIGWMVSMGGQIGNSSQVLLGIAIIGLIAWLMESLVFRRIERHYQHWRTINT